LILANLGFPPTQLRFGIFNLCGIMEISHVSALWSGIGIFLFAGVAGFGYLLEFLG
jgi:hypothetical protein